jgi:hypothetical protein
MAFCYCHEENFHNSFEQSMFWIVGSLALGLGSCLEKGRPVGYTESNVRESVFSCEQTLLKLHVRQSITRTTNKGLVSSCAFKGCFFSCGRNWPPNHHSNCKGGSYDIRMRNRSMQIILVRPSQVFISMRSNTVLSIFGGPATVSENSFECIIMG